MVFESLRWLWRGALLLGGSQLEGDESGDAEGPDALPCLLRLPGWPGLGGGPPAAAELYPLRPAYIEVGHTLPR